MARKNKKAMSFSTEYLVGAIIILVFAGLLFKSWVLPGIGKGTGDLGIIVDKSKDYDGDILAYDDLCPCVAGSESNKGCPRGYQIIGKPTKDESHPERSAPCTTVQYA